MEHALEDTIAAVAMLAIIVICVWFGGRDEEPPTKP